MTVLMLDETILSDYRMPLLLFQLNLQLVLVSSLQYTTIAG